MTAMTSARTRTAPAVSITVAATRALLTHAGGMTADQQAALAARVRALATTRAATRVVVEKGDVDRMAADVLAAEATCCWCGNACEPGAERVNGRPFCRRDDGVTDCAAAERARLAIRAM